MRYINFLATAVVTSLLFILFVGSSSGTASVNQRGYTGAPSAGGGTEGACGSCHRTGNFGQPLLTVSFAEEGSQEFEALTSYVPGRTYQVSVAVGYGAATPQGYGFQAQVLTAADSPVTAGTLAAPNAGTQVATVRERQYAEHNSISDDSTFVFNWTAPAAGSGSVNVYAVGNLVNRGQGRTGDNGSNAPTIVALEEGSTTSTNNLSRRIEGGLYPNPVLARSQVQLKVEVEQSGWYELTVLNAMGQTLQQSGQTLIAGEFNREISTGGLKPGLYIVSLRGRAGMFSGRLLIH